MRHRVITSTCDTGFWFYDIHLEEYRDNKWQKVGCTKMVSADKLGEEIADMLQQANS